MIKKFFKKEMVVLAIFFFALILGWNLYDYKTSVFGGDDVLAAAQTHVASLSVTVQQSITLTQTTGDTVSFGALTAGTRVTGATGLTVTTNGPGMNITAGRQRANLTPATLASNAAPNVVANQIDDDAGGIDIFNGIGNCTTSTSEPKPWSAGVSTGLGFANYAFRGGSAKSTTCWGSGATATDALNQYAALQASISASSFISSSGFSSTGANVSIGYSLDVTGSQRATTYTGGVVFTATSTP